VVGGILGIERDRLGDQPLGGFVSASLAGSTPSRCQLSA
jgi:hypothetical protein